MIPQCICISKHHVVLNIFSKGKGTMGYQYVNKKRTQTHVTLHPLKLLHITLCFLVIQVVPIHVLWVYTPHSYHSISIETIWQGIFESLLSELFTIYHCLLLKIIKPLIPRCRVAWFAFLSLKLLSLLCYVPTGSPHTAHPGSQGSLCSDALRIDAIHLRRSTTIGIQIKYLVTLPLNIFSLDLFNILLCYSKKISAPSNFWKTHHEQFLATFTFEIFMAYQEVHIRTYEVTFKLTKI